ncbi:MAG: carbohydrate kinase family protein [Anaerolineae bacterium]|nr:carbohydrate kinase family protein [Anaerolineae bacterium]
MAHNGLTQPYVLVVGAAGIDSKGRASGPLTLGSNTPGFVRVSVGGTARNVADNLARLGVETVLISAIGVGGNGRHILANAAQVGINTDFVIVSETHHTSAYLAILDETGNLVMSVDDMEALSCITPQVIHWRRSLIKNAAMVVIDSNLSQAAIGSIFKAAKRYNTPVCADPASTTVATRLKPHLSDVYMITPNVPEAEVLAGRSIGDENEAITAARALVNAGVRIVIITLAEAGVVYASASDSGRIPAVATDIVDFTGASDALTAAVVFGLLNDIPLDESVRLGASAAALTLACSDTVCAELSLDLLYDRLLI